MSTIATAFVLAIVVVVVVDAIGLSWQPQPRVPDLGRHHPITFANETHGFILTGHTANGETSDFYVYDERNRKWSRNLAFTPSAFPGSARSFGYGVVLGEYGHTKAYVGFGSAKGKRLKDLWEFDMSTHTWTRLAELPGPGRRHPAMNSVRTPEGKWEIHVGCGDTHVNGTKVNLNDWWAYSVEDNTWRQLDDFPGPRRHHPFHFSIGTMSYAGFGHGDNQGVQKIVYRDWYGYDTNRSQWTVQPELASYEVDNNGTVADMPVTTEARVAGTQFSIELPLKGSNSQLFGSLGFALSGDGETHGPMPTGEFHAFYPEGNELGIIGPNGSAAAWWRSLPPHPGGSRWAPGCFVMRGTARAYFHSGLDKVTGKLQNDVWLIDLSPIFGGEAVDITPVKGNSNALAYVTSSSPVVASLGVYVLAICSSLTVSVLIGVAS